MTPMTMALFFSLYCLEAGLFFLVVPWTRFWSVNPLIQWLEAAGVMATSPWARGFVSGIGVVHLLVGFYEIARIIAWQRRRRAPRA